MASVPRRNRASELADLDAMIADAKAEGAQLGIENGAGSGLASSLAELASEAGYRPDSHFDQMDDAMELDASEGVRDEAPPAPAPSRARAAPKARTGRTPKSSKVPRAKSSRPRSRADAGEPRPRKGKIPAPLAGVLAAGRGASPTTAAAGKPPTLPAAAHPPPSTETDADAESATSPGPAPAPASDGVEEDRLRRSLKAAQRRMRDIVKQSRKEQMALQSRLAELEAQVRSGGASPGSGSGSAAAREAEARAAAAVATVVRLEAEAARLREEQERAAAALSSERSAHEQELEEREAAASAALARAQAATAAEAERRLAAEKRLADARAAVEAEREAYRGKASQLAEAKGLWQRVLGDMREELDATAAERETQAQEAEAARREAAELRGKLSDAERREAAVGNKAAAAEARAAELLSRLEAAEAESAGLRAKAADAEARAADAEARAADAEARAADAEARAADAEARAADAEARAADAEARAADAEARAADAEARAADDEARAADAEARAADDEARAADAEARAADAEAGGSLRAGAGQRPGRTDGPAHSDEEDAEAAAATTSGVLSPGGSPKAGLLRRMSFRAHSAGHLVRSPASPPAQASAPQAGHATAEDEPSLGKVDLIADAAGPGTLLTLGPGAHVKVGDADVSPIPNRKVARCVVPIVSLFTVGILAAVLIKVGGDVAGVLRVRTSAGVINGFYDGVADSWMGVPYGRAPVRWGAPVETKWDEMKDATRPGPVCPQGKAFGYDLTAQESSETDCLVLNVFAPHGAAKAVSDGSQGVAMRPVMVFLHGGGFVVGSGSQSLYNASLLARRADAIVVVVQYRLGALGFLAHSALTAQDGTSGNYGMLDQQAALQWLYKNVGSFGGDAGQVTLWGHGAGGISALQHIAMPSSTDFFRRVLVQSAAWDALPMRVDAEKDGAAFAGALGCSGAGSDEATLACMRSKPVEEAVAASMTPALWRRWSPVLDGTHIKHQLRALLSDPLFATAAVPGGILAGMGANDSTAILSFLFDNSTSTSGRGNGETGGAHAGPVAAITPSSLEGHVSALFPGAASASAIADFYRAEFNVPAAGSDPDVRAFQAVAQAASDGALMCPQRRMLGVVNGSGLPTYMYQLQHALSFVDPRLGASHFQDVSLAFGQPCFITCENYEGNFLPVERQLSNRLMDSFAAFARGASPGSAAAAPSGDTVRGWPAFADPSVGRGEALARLDVPVSTVGSVRDDPDACAALWDAQHWPVHSG
ncbi:hypothetical protein FNF31_03889 [Cafeteria roenbergensis]|uniref:Carboxylesterase type B domain-containing protein n=1 Tax=Cafeteria roenbergensis TaxID=33653 RepID=A0A5A8D7A0_CAFRO|nr:hypothetical protein FNF31_03889 [Cafeteria roenbergensis]